MKFIDFLKKIQEEGEAAVPANSVGAGKVAGLGVGPQGEPGRKVVLGKMIRRRKFTSNDKR
jgi:hypothetical protein